MHIFEIFDLEGMGHSRPHDALVLIPKTSKTLF